MRPNFSKTLTKRVEAGATKNYDYVVSYESPIDGGVNLWHCGEIPFVFHNVDLVAGSYGGSQDAYDLQDVMASAWVNFATPEIQMERKYQNGAPIQMTTNLLWYLIPQVEKELTMMLNYRN